MRYIIQIEDVPYIKKNFLNDDEIVYKVKGFNFFLTEEEISKLPKDNRPLFERKNYPLEDNEDYKKFYK